MHGHNDVNINNIDEQFHYKNLEKKKADPVNKEPSVFDDPVLKSRLDATNERVEKNYNPFALQNANMVANKPKQIDERAARTKTLSDALKRVNKNKNALTHTANVHVPKNTVLFSEYGTTYKNSMWAWRRASKINNIKSRLYAKHQNYKVILTESDTMTRRKNEAMNEAMEGRMVGVASQETFHDLSAFMVSTSMAKIGKGLGVQDDKCAKKNKELLDDFLGVYNQETGEIENQNRTRFYDKITAFMFGFDVSDVNFENDTEMVKHAGKLENLVNCVGAYDRLMKDSDAYFEGMEPKLKKAINDRIDYLRSVAAYYQSRKELLSDETYRTHYDHELTMEVKDDTPKDQRALAQKLMNSYVLGRHMMKLNSGNKNAPDNVLEIHFENDKSRQLFNEAMDLRNTDLQKKYLEKAYTSMDYLAAGIQLNANNLILDGGKQDRADYYLGTNHVYDESINRSQQDIDKIKNMLEAKGFDLNRLDDSYKFYNPMTGLYHNGLALGRLLESFPKRLTARMGIVDIVNMLSGLFAPSMEQNKNIDLNSEAGKKLNADFNAALKTFKNIQLSGVRSYMNSFGNLPQQLSAKDNEKLLKKYGDVIKEYCIFDQTTGQMYEADRMSNHLVVGDRNKKDSTRELMYKNAYFSLSRACFVEIPDNNNEDAFEPEEHALLNLNESLLNDPILLTESFENNSYITGPSMTKKQLAKYEKKLKATMSQQEFERYKNRRKLYTDTTSAVFKMWENEKLTAYKANLTTLINQDGDNHEEIMALSRKVDLHIRTLETLKKKPSWENPDLEKDQAIRKKIILARENENYLIGIKRAIKLGYEYKLLEKPAEKQKTKNELDTCLTNLKVVNNEYIALARWNAMKEIEKPADIDYSAEAFNEVLAIFNQLNIKQIKISSFEDVIKNYNQNMAMCYKAEQFQNMLGEAIINGRNDFTDKFLMEARAKLTVFHEVRRISTLINSILCEYPDCMNDPENENDPVSVSSRLTNALSTGSTHITAIWPGVDLTSYYKEVLAGYKRDHNDREDAIYNAYYMVTNKFKERVEFNALDDQNEQEEEYQYPTPTAQELSKRKRDYQKNQAVAEYLSRLTFSMNQDIEEKCAAVKAYCHRNGMNMPHMERIQAFAGLKPGEAIDLYKKYVGSPDDQVEFYRIMLKDIIDTDIEEFQMGDFKKLFKGSSIKRRMKIAMLATGADDYGEKIANLVKNGAVMPVGLGAKTPQELKMLCKVIANFYCAYPNRLSAFAQMDVGRFRGATYLDDYKNLDPKIAIKKALDEDDPSEERYIAVRENYAKHSFLYPRCNDETEEVAEYAKLDAKLKPLYNEEYRRVFGKYPEDKKGRKK